MFLFGFVVGCLTIIVAEVAGIIVYAVKRSKKK